MKTTARVENGNHARPARRSLPAVEKVLHELGETGLARPVVLAVVRRELAARRRTNVACDLAEFVAQVRTILGALERSRIQPVINGTGVIIHTNLGRAPLGARVLETLAAIGANYNNLELDLETGERGRRAGYLEHNLAVVCGAEAATVVNNCAAALVLLVRHFLTDQRREVVISRGELVQIGGGFRIPEILESSGARLREVGATNKTTAADYGRALGAHTALVLKVHRSNFFMGGFVESPRTEELAALARRQRIPLVEDLGSGAVLATERLAALDHEPTPAEVLKQGVDLVCCSGDKLLGGPQAGIIAGKARLVAALKRAPLFRALRCDKLILSALQTTVDLYLSGAAETAVPVVALLEVPLPQLRARADKLVAALGGLPVAARVGAGASQLGGGTLPRSALESVVLELQPKDLPLGEFAARLRAATPPVIGYVSGSRFKLDLRTVFPHQDAALGEAIRKSLQAGAMSAQNP